MVCVPHSLAVGVTLIRQQRLDHRPLLFIRIVSRHAIVIRITILLVVLPNIAHVAHKIVIVQTLLANPPHVYPVLLPALIVNPPIHVMVV